MHLINFRITADEASDRDKDNTWRNTKYLDRGYVQVGYICCNEIKRQQEQLLIAANEPTFCGRAICADFSDSFEFENLRRHRSRASNAKA